MAAAACWQGSRGTRWEGEKGCRHRWVWGCQVGTAAPAKKAATVPAFTLLSTRRQMNQLIVIGSVITTHRMPCGRGGGRGGRGSCRGKGLQKASPHSAPCPPPHASSVLHPLTPSPSPARLCRAVCCLLGCVCAGAVLHQWTQTAPRVLVNRLKSCFQGEFLVGQVVRTQRFYCWGPGFSPWSGN